MMNWIVSHDLLSFIYSINILSGRQGGDKTDETPVFEIHLALVLGTILHGFDPSIAGSDTPIPSLYSIPIHVHVHREEKQPRSLGQTRRVRRI